MKRNLLIAVLLISFALLISPAIVAAQDSYTISLEGYTWNHTAITVFIGEHHAAWYDSSFKAHVETAVSDWNEAIDSFWTEHYAHVTSYIHDVQFQLETDKKAADVIVTFALYRGAVPPFAVAGVTGFFTQRNTNVVRGGCCQDKVFRCLADELSLWILKVFSSFSWIGLGAPRFLGGTGSL